MKELRWIPQESDSAALVFREADGQGDATEYFLALDPDQRRRLIDVLAGMTARAVAPTNGEPGTPAGAPGAQAEEAGAASARESAEAETNAGATAGATVGAADAAPAAETPGAGAQPNAEAGATARGAATRGAAADAPAARGAAEAGVEENPAPKRRAPLALTPREIQYAVRHGATPEAVAEYLGVEVERIDSFTGLIVHERATMAQLARAARPVIDGEVIGETLWETLATSLASRGAALAESHWDAYQDDADHWVVRITWSRTTAGRSSDHEISYRLELARSGPKLAHPTDATSRDLADPRYASGPASRTDRGGAAGMGPGPAAGLLDPTVPAPQQPDAEQRAGADARAEGEETGAASGRQRGGDRTRETARETGREMGRDTARESEPEAADTGFLQHPEPAAEPKKNQHSRVETPPWEDVLLGVRSRAKHAKKKPRR